MYKGQIKLIKAINDSNKEGVLECIKEGVNMKGKYGAYIFSDILMADNPDILSTMMDHGFTLIHPKKSLFSVLKQCIHYGSTKISEFIIKRFEFDLSERDKKGFNLIHYTIYNERLRPSILRIMCQYGANIDSKISKGEYIGQTVFHLIAEDIADSKSLCDHHIECLNILLSAETQYKEECMYLLNNNNLDGSNETDDEEDSIEPDDNEESDFCLDVYSHK